MKNYINDKLHLKINNLTSSRPIKVWCRNTTIQEDYINKSFLVHNGNKFILVKIKEDMMGHKLGEFATTRKLCVFKKNNQKKKKK